MNVAKRFAETPPVSNIKKIHSLNLKLLHADGQIVEKDNGHTNETCTANVNCSLSYVQH